MIALSSVFAAPSGFASEASCLGLSRLPQAMSAALSLDLPDSKLKARLTPVGGDAYVVQDETSCGLGGRCDSVLFVPDSRGCYFAALVFSGRWIGVEKKDSRTSLPLSVRIETGMPAKIEILSVESKR